MPIYEYKCQKCGFIIETLQKVNDPPLKECAKCGGLLKKVISSPAIQFKGSGWYITDYARKKKPEKESKEKPKIKKKDAAESKKEHHSSNAD